MEDRPLDRLVEVDSHASVRGSGKRHVATSDRPPYAYCFDPDERALDAPPRDARERGGEADAAEARLQLAVGTFAQLRVGKARLDAP